MPVDDKRRLVFWQNIPSIHQASLLRSLAERWDGEVAVVAERAVSSQRQLQGWERPDFKPARLLVAPSEMEREQLLDRNPEASVHIFSGFHAESNTYATFKAALRRELEVGVFAEAARRGGLKGVLRRVWYAGHAVRWGPHLSFLLTPGRLGIEWYRRCGFSDRILHPFGYFVAPMGQSVARSENPSRDIRFLFVGQLIEHKGVDLLLYALSHLESVGWRLEVVGDGPRSQALRDLASRLGLVPRIHWHGILPNAEVRALMGSVDCLVLPSRFDGWGAVVNEALLAGTPAIVSDAAGAADLIQGERIGRIFRSESVDDLTDALRGRLERGRVDRSERRAIRGWAEEYIVPAAAADYLLSVLGFAFAKGDTRPVPPWRQEESVQLARGDPEASNPIC